MDSSFPPFISLFKINYFHISETGLNQHQEDDTKFKHLKYPAIIQPQKIFQKNNFKKMQNYTKDTKVILSKAQ